MGNIKQLGKRALVGAVTLATAVSMTALSASAATTCTPGTPGHNVATHHPAVTHQVKHVTKGTPDVTKTQHQYKKTTPAVPAETQTQHQFKRFVKGSPEIRAARLYELRDGINVYYVSDTQITTDPGKATYVNLNDFPRLTNLGWSAYGELKVTPATPDQTFYKKAGGESTNKADAGWFAQASAAGYTEFNTRTVVTKPGTPAKTVYYLPGGGNSNTLTPANWSDTSPGAPYVSVSTRKVVTKKGTPDKVSYTTVIDKPAYTTNVWVAGKPGHCTTVKDNSAAAAHAKAVAKAKAAAHARAVARAEANAKAAHARAVAKAKAAAHARAVAKANAAAHARAVARAEATARANAALKAHSNVPDARTGLGDTSSTPWGGIAAGGILLLGAGLLFTSRRREDEQA